jgi:hypothetical protein
VAAELTAELAIARSQTWLQHAVIGLNLCPFARAVQARGLVRWACSDARRPATLRQALALEMQRLRDTPASQIDTTLLVHPWVLADFTDYNQFLDEADALLDELGLDGVLQVASFHPDYRFAGTRADDIGNATNRSPYPMLHLLREASVERALAQFGDSDAIVEHNQRRMRALGPHGWAQLQSRWLGDAPMPPADGDSGTRTEPTTGAE